MSGKQNIEISWASLWRIFFMLALAVALYLTREIIIIFLLAIVISSAIDAPLTFLEKRKIPRVLSLIFIFLAFFLLLGVILYTIIPISILEFRNVFNNLDKLQSALEGVPGITNLTSSANQFFDRLTTIFFNGNLSVTNIIPSIFTNVFLTITTIVVSFFLALNRDGVEQFLISILPYHLEEYAVSVLHRTRKKIGKWLQAQIILSVLIGFSTFLGMKLLGVNFALAIGLLAGLLEIIPYIGPIVTGLFAFLLSAPVSIPLAIKVLILFTIIQQTESNLLVPIVMKKTVDIHPVIAAFALLAGSTLAGFPGFILGIPAAAMFQEIINDWTDKKHSTNVPQFKQSSTNASRQKQ